jgi:hypothetical protein
MSTTIIVEGDESLVTRDRRFVCPFCHAVFIADSESYTLATLGEEGDTAALAYVGVKEDPGIEAFATCPTCGQKAISPSGSGGEVPTPVALVIQSQPKRRVFTAMTENFIRDGLELGLRFSNGIIGKVTVAECTFDPVLTRGLEVTDTKVTVTHTATGLSVDIPITVNPLLMEKPYLVRDDLVYTGEWQRPVFSYHDLSALRWSGDSQGKLPGEYVTKVKPVPEYARWSDGTLDEISIPWHIAKADPIIDPPTPLTGLIYTGEAQALTTPGGISGGTMKYKLDDGAWGTSVPTATDAGEYTVAWRADGDSNHNDVPETVLPVIVIAPAG